MKCELFEFNNEEFQTGIPLIDKLLEGKKMTPSINIDDIKDINPLADNEIIEDSANNLIDYTANNIFGNDIF